MCLVMHGYNTGTTGLSTFQHTERKPAVICGSRCEDTAIFRSVSEWKSSSWRQCFLSTIRGVLAGASERKSVLCFGNASHSEEEVFLEG
jgi:hypothetical protein